MLVIITLLVILSGLKMAGNNSGKPSGKPAPEIVWQRNGKDGKPITYRYTVAVVANAVGMTAEALLAIPEGYRLKIAQQYHADNHAVSGGGKRDVSEKVIKYFVDEKGTLSSDWRETLKKLAGISNDEAETLRQSVMKARKSDQKANAK